MRTSSLMIVCGAVAVAGLAACAGGLPEVPATVVDPCRLAGPAGAGSDSAVVVLFGPVSNVYAPAGHNDAERLEFAQRYETLLRMDCDGHLRAGLAEYPPVCEGRRCVLTLRAGASFTDGTPLTADDVVQGWRDAIALGAGVDSAQAIDDRHMAAYLERPGLAVLAAPSLAVMQRMGPGQPPMGTVAPIVTFATRADMDPRDALRGAGVMTVGDSAVAAYASSLGMKTAALPFDRTYLLLSPARVRSILSSAHPDALAAVTQRDLAFSVRAAVTRATASAAWWVTDLNGCGPLPAWPSWRLPAAPARTGAPSVYYDERDATARDLAERIVALAAMDTTRSAAAAGLARSVPMPVGGMAVIAKGVDISELSSRMQHGDGFIFITSIPSPVPDPCGAARALLRAAPWLVAGDAPVAQSVVPLVDARRFVVVGHPALAVEWDVFGTIRIVPAGAGAR